MASPNLAASAYAAVQRLGAAGVPALPAVAKPEAAGAAAGFPNMLQQFVGDTAESARKAEASIAQAAAGKGDLVDVVTAVAESEAALETLVAVRDRVIAAYEEIMRMPM
jgi:flagellar hook-basal body complex protein FliE